jgi:hypothetical protein
MRWILLEEKMNMKKKPPAKSRSKIVLNTDVAIPRTETDSPPLETITIPEIVEAMIKSVEEKNFVESLQDVGTQIQVKKGNKKVLVTLSGILQHLPASCKKPDGNPSSKRRSVFPTF